MIDLVDSFTQQQTVYKLLLANNEYYIGRTKQLGVRIAEHIAEGKLVIDAKIIQTNVCNSKICRLEIRHIRDNAGMEGFTNKVLYPHCACNMDTPLAMELLHKYGVPPLNRYG